MFSCLLLAAALLLGLANSTVGNQVFQTLENKIGQKFAAVKVDRAKLAIAVGALGMSNAYNFKNNLVNDQLSGVKRENLESVGNFVCLKLGLMDHVRKDLVRYLLAHCRSVKTAFQMMGLSDESEAKLEEVSAQIGFQSLYGFISGVRNSQGDVDIVYAITHHTQSPTTSHPRPPTTTSPPRSTSPLTPTRSTTPSATTRSTRPSTTTRSYRSSTTDRSFTRPDLHQTRPFTIEEWEAILVHYSKYEALRMLKQENVIDSISYV